MRGNLDESTPGFSAHFHARRNPGKNHLPEIQPSMLRMKNMKTSEDPFGPIQRVASQGRTTPGSAACSWSVNPDFGPQIVRRSGEVDLIRAGGPCRSRPDGRPDGFFMVPSSGKTRHSTDGMVKLREVRTSARTSRKVWCRRTTCMVELRLNLS